MDPADAPPPERVEPESFSLWENLWWGLTNEGTAGVTAYLLVAIGFIAAMLLTDSDTITYVALAYGAVGVGLGVYYGMRLFWMLSKMTDEERENVGRVLEEMDDETDRVD